jgi:hypothetical protein
MYVQKIGLEISPLAYMLHFLCQLSSYGGVTRHKLWNRQKSVTAVTKKLRSPLARKISGLA